MYFMLKGDDIYNAEEYIVFLDGKASTHTDNIFSAVAILFSSYYVFNIEYPKEACVTMEFIQRYVDIVIHVWLNYNYSNKFSN